MAASPPAVGGSGAGADQDQYSKWRQLTPYIYDYLANHNLTWPSLSCRWGRVYEDAKWRTRQLLYLSEQTSGEEPNKLTVMMADVVKPRTAAAEVIRQFDEGKSNKHIKPYQTIFHPGEVNKIREVPHHESVLVTHTDSAEVYVWSLERQPNRASDKTPALRQQMSVPDLVLEGHTDQAEFALGVSSAEPLVASGGRDTNVLVWSIADHVTTLTATGKMHNAVKGERLQHRTKLEGHRATVEDVVWKPSSGAELASVGDDRGLLLWDTRAGTGPALRKTDAHGTHDLHTVDWSGLREELLATGAADGSLRIWDRRKIGGKDAALFTFDLHTEALMHVEWCPHRPGVVASCGEDKLLYVWDLDQNKRPGGEPEAKKARGAYPPQLLFTHAGHRASVVDFHWNPAEPFTLMSVADDSALDKGGGTLQLWRISDLITRPEEEVLVELEPHREFIITGTKAGAKPAAADVKEEPAANGTKAVANGKAEPDTEAAADAPDAKEEPQTDDAEGKGGESEPGSAPAEAPLSEAEAKTSGDEQAGGGASAEDADDDGEEKMDTDD